MKKKAKSQVIAESSQPYGNQTQNITQLREIPYSLLARVTTTLDLSDVKPIRFSAMTTRSLVNIPIDQTYDQVIGIRARREGNIVDAAWVVVEFFYRMMDNDRDVAHTDGALVVIYGLREPLPADLTQETIDLGLEVNGLFNTWPFVRQLVSDSMQKLGGNVMLPLLRPPNALPPLGEWFEIKKPRTERASGNR